MGDYHSRALAHYDGECMKCGMSNEQHNGESGRNLDVHHIDGDSNNNDLSNLAVLCRSCHRKVHYGTEGYEDLHEQLPESRRWETTDEWKTLRVPAEAYLEAKQQKEVNDRTWGEQIVRDSDKDTTTDGVDVPSLGEDEVAILARDEKTAETLAETLESVAEGRDFPVSGGNDLESLKRSVETVEERTGTIERQLDSITQR